MIRNLPAKFPKHKLTEVHIGDADGGEDHLLEACACRLSAMQEFLGEKKQIVIGERGTGKTALTKLISTQKLAFANLHEKRQLVLVIDDEIDYRGIREYLRKKEANAGPDKSLAYRFIWEVFLLYRVLSFLSTAVPECKKFIELKREFASKIGLETAKPKILDLLLSHKKTVGFKVDNLGAPTPSIAPFFSLEPPVAGSDAREADYVELSAYKTQISNALQSENYVLYVLADRLDEFVVGEEYHTQRFVLEGLLECHRGYAAFKWVYLRPFMRFDLFQRLTFEKLGPEKVRSKTIELRWNATDIREFIARRLAYNYFRLFELQRLEFSIDREKLFLGQDSLSGLVDEPAKQTKFTKIAANILARSPAVKFFFGALETVGVPIRRGRTRYLTDELNRQIILTIFPESFELREVNGKLAQLGFFEFLDTHFAFGSGFVTPRTFILFLEKCFERARNYYRLNPDLEIELGNESGVYPLFHSDMISEAYEEVRKLAWDSVTGVSNEWAPFVSRLRQGRHGRSDFTFHELEEMLKEKRSKTRDFAAFGAHVGMLSCENSAAAPDDRRYSLPLLFRGD